MNLISFALILTGVMLNACAQLLLKAGVNAIGRFEFSVGNLLPIGIKMAWPPGIFSARSFRFNAWQVSVLFCLACTSWPVVEPPCPDPRHGRAEQVLQLPSHR